MEGKSKLESIKSLACVTSSSLQLQNLLLLCISRRKILDNLLQKNSLKKKNYFLEGVIKWFIKQLNLRSRSIWYKPRGSDIF